MEPVEYIEMSDGVKFNLREFISIMEELEETTNPFDGILLNNISIKNWLETNEFIGSDIKGYCYGTNKFYEMWPKLKEQFYEFLNKKEAINRISKISIEELINKFDWDILEEIMENIYIKKTDEYIEMFNNTLNPIRSWLIENQFIYIDNVKFTHKGVLFNEMWKELKNKYDKYWDAL